MSRIGKKAINIPSGVKVSVNGALVQVEGPKGKLALNLPPYTAVSVADNQVLVTPTVESRSANAMHGLARALINNMVIGVSAGFVKELQIIGIGYKAELKGKNLNLTLGFSHPVNFPVPEGIKIVTDAEGKIVISGCDKQLVGETAAQIRRFRPPEPYKGKGIRYVDERVVLKEGKSVG